MAKTYFLRFGFGDPRTYTGLAPTFLQFTQFDGTQVSPPAITENYNVNAGVTTGTGVYKFTFGTTLPISFLADAATISPGPQGRYVSGCIDPADRADEYGTTMIAIGTSAVAQGVTMIAIGTSIYAQGSSLSVSVAGLGSTASSFGTSSTDPVDLFGYMKRIQELMEGNQTFVKPSGSLTMYSRGGSVTLAIKTIANSISLVVKS